MFYSNFSNKKTIDRAVITFWFAFLLINAVSHYIIVAFTGIGVIALHYIFMAYFVFIYGGPKSSKTRISTISLLLFIILFVLEIQLLYKSGSYYESMGIRFSTHVWNMFSFLPAVISSICILQKTDEITAKYMKSVFMLFSSVIAVVSIIYLSIDYSSLKITATGHSEYVPFTVDYAIIYAFSIAIPFFLNDIKNYKNKIIPILFFAVIVATVLFSSFFIAITAMILSIVVYLLFSVKNKHARVLTITLFLLLSAYLFFSGLGEKLLLYIADVIPMEQISKRIRQVLLYTETGVAADTTGRIMLYFSALKTVVQHPITGNLIWDRNVVLSEHSTILDIWGGCGIIILLLFLKYLWSVYRYNATSHSTEFRSKRALMASLISLLFVAVLNPILASPNIIIFWSLIPMMFSANTKHPLKSDKIYEQI